MLTISTIPEALAKLAKVTGREWTDSELFDVAVTHSIKLHAAPPITAQTTIQEFVIGEGLKEKFRSGPGHAALAVLFTWQVQQLWISGETVTRHPSDHARVEGEYHWFTEPVRVTREQVRIVAPTLERIVTVWKKAQAGRWIPDPKQPGGMYCQRGPDWLFPTEQPAPATETAEPVLPAGAPETPEQRRARWLELFEAEQKRQKRGALQRLADSLGMNRSNLSKDLDRARTARTEQKRAGNGWGSQLVQDGKRRG